MKKHLFSALAVAVLGSVGVVQSATFLSISDNSASASAPWSIGVQFTVPAAGVVINDIQYFNVKAGNTIRVGLWASGAPNGAGNATYSTTIVSSSGTGGFTSVGNGNIPLAGGSYILAASGFTAANSYGDTALANSVPVYNSPSVLTGRGDIIAFSSDPTFINPFNIGYSTATERFKTVNFTYSVIPEPETYAMVAGAALVGFGLWRRRQSK